MKYQVLIVDDNYDFRRMIRQYLKSMKKYLEISEASSGELGIKKAKLRKPHIILMDIMLPGINGIEAAQKIKSIVPDCHVIVLSIFQKNPFWGVTEEDTRMIDKEEGREKRRSSRIDETLQKKDDTFEFTYIAKSELYNRLLPAIHICLHELERTQEHTKERGVACV